MRRFISQNWGLLVVLLIILTIIAGRLLYIRVQTHVFKGEYPVNRIETYEHWVTVYPSVNTRLGDFVDMSLFYGFTPEMTFSDAVNRFGEPDNIRREDRGNTYYEYWKNNARVEVGREEYSTGNNNDPIGVTWVLYSYPKDINYIQILNPKIINTINPASKKTTVIIENQNGNVGVLIEILGNRVEKLIRNSE